MLHELLLCLKGLCTTQRALDKLAEASSTLFPNLLRMLFDEERKGPSEFNTRAVVINLLCKQIMEIRGMLSDDSQSFTWPLHRRSTLPAEQESFSPI